MTLFEKAVDFAAKKHGGARRKLDGKPYILHPLEAALIVSAHTDDEEVLAAAVLHDVVEDTEVTIGDIEKKFGRRVAELVASETEDKRPGVPKAESWLARKKQSLEELERADDPGVKLLWLGDKLSNMRSLKSAFDELGPEVYKRFNQQDPAMHAWYYRSIARLLGEFSEHEDWKELNGLIETVFDGVPDNEI